MSLLWQRQQHTSIMAVAAAAAVAASHHRYGSETSMMPDFTFPVVTREDKKHVVMAPLKIARRYLRSWFLLDILVVSLDWFMLFAETEGADTASDVSKSFRTLRFMRVLRLVRMLKMVRVIQVARSSCRLSSPLSPLGPALSACRSGAARRRRWGVVGVLLSRAGRSKFRPERALRPEDPRGPEEPPSRTRPPSQDDPPPGLFFPRGVNMCCPHQRLDFARSSPCNMHFLKCIFAPDKLEC